MSFVADDKVQAEVVRYITLIICFSALLAFLEKSSKCVSNFLARKMAHAGTGSLLLQLDSKDAQARLFVYIFGVCSLAMTWQLIPKLKQFRFGRTGDIGMTAYCCIAVLWFYYQLPVMVLAPMFFADPMGAIVGKWLSGMKDQGVRNPVWWNYGGVTKTLGGSAAVFVFTALTFASPATLSQRLIVAALAVLAEAMGGAFDNLFLVLVVVGSRVVMFYIETGNVGLEVGNSALALHEPSR